MRSARTASLRVLGLVLAAAVATAATLSASHAGARAQAAYPREQTLYTTGTQWGDIQGFDPFASSYATGTVGLAYETLFRYDPVKDATIPWLATRSTWIGPRDEVLTIRSGVTWSDGSPFTAADVAWNLALGRFDTSRWHALYQELEPGGVTVSGTAVHLSFAATPDYGEWTTLLWSLPMVDPSQWAGVTADTLLSFDADPPVGTGPYVLDPGGYEPSTQVAWRKTPTGWWAASAGLEPDPKPLYIVDRVNGGDQFSDLLYGRVDFTDGLIRDFPAYLGTGLGLHTYGSRPPYYFPDNTVWAVTNTTREPLSDPSFRRALAEAIDVDRIVAHDYSGAVVKADPTGLVPTLSRYVDRSVVARYGFSHDVGDAVRTLRAAGYVDSDGDGYVENKDGSSIDLTLAVPSGWFDWEIAVAMISSSAKQAGIRITPSPADWSTWYAERSSGDFDLLIDNSVPLTDTPWTTFDYLFRQPVAADQSTANFARFSGPAADQAWRLTRQLDQTPPGDLFARRALSAQIERIMLEQLPAIPLWYNGAWSEQSERYWTSWPSAGGSLQFVPLLWDGSLQLTGIDAIAHLQPSP